MTFKLLILFIFFVTSRQVNILRTLAWDELTKKADTKVALPWGPDTIAFTKTFVKEGNTLIVSLFGTVSTGNQWRLLNAEELKEKWGIEAINLKEDKSAPTIMLDNISGSRKFHHKDVWKFLFKATKVLPNDDTALILFSYAKSFDGEPEQQAKIKVVIVPKEK